MSNPQKFVPLAQILEDEFKALVPSKLAGNKFNSNLENLPPKIFDKGKEVSRKTVALSSRPPSKATTGLASKVLPPTSQIPQPSGTNHKPQQKLGRNAGGSVISKNTLPNPQSTSGLVTPSKTGQKRGRSKNKSRNKTKNQDTIHPKLSKLVILKLHQAPMPINFLPAMRPPTNGRSMLVELPREIRDMIYDLVYDGAFVQHSSFSCRPNPLKVRTSAYSREGGKLKIDHDAPILLRVLDPTVVTIRQPDIHPNRDRSLPLVNIPTLSKTNFKERLKGTSLLFTCKQILEEFSQSAYPKTIFAFGSPYGLRRMLRNGPSVLPGHLRRPGKSKRLSTQLPIASTSRSAIKYICLSIGAYGEPYSRTDTVWRAKYYAAWASACQLIATRLPTLEQLTLLVDVPDDRPLSLSLSAPWAAPLLQFASMESLKTISVTLTSPADRNISYETLGAFTGVLLRMASGWDQSTALKAIEWWKFKHVKDSKGRSLEGRWRMLEAWNDLEMQT